MPTVHCSSGLCVPAGNAPFMTDGQEMSLSLQVGVPRSELSRTYQKQRLIALIAPLALGGVVSPLGMRCTPRIRA